MVMVSFVLSLRLAMKVKRSSAVPVMPIAQGLVYLLFVKKSLV